MKKHTIILFSLLCAPAYGASVAAMIESAKEKGLTWPPTAAELLASNPPFAEQLHLAVVATHAPNGPQKASKPAPLRLAPKPPKLHPALLELARRIMNGGDEECIDAEDSYVKIHQSSPKNSPKLTRVEPDIDADRLALVAAMSSTSEDFAQTFAAHGTPFVPNGSKKIDENWFGR